MGLLQNPPGGATSALQLIIANNEGTLATAAGVAAVANNQGTLATSANQVAANTTLGVIMNTQGTQATAAGVAAVANNQGTQATAAGVAVVANNQGTLATAAVQAQMNTTLGVIMNNEGTLANAVGQNLTNATLSTIANGEGTLAKLLATVINTEGATGTNATSALNCEISFSDHAAIDAFGRLRISTPDYRFDSQLTYHINSDIWDLAFNSTGTITHDTTNRMATVTCAANGTAVLQSHKYAPYTPGRSQLAFMTFVLGSTPGFGTVRRVGYYDGSNGVYLEQTPNGNNLVLASTTANGNQTVAQSSWNIDKMDGTGPSGLTLDLTKVQIMVVSLQALYVGRLLVGFDIGGTLFPVHQFTHANRITTPYMALASLPVRYETRSTGSNTLSMNAICASVMSEGGGELSAIPARTFGAGRTSTATAGSKVPLISIRVMPYYYGLPNTSVVLPNTVSISSSAQVVLIELIRNPTSLTGAAFAAFDTNSSCVEVDTTATAITGGKTVYAIMVGAGGAAASQVEISPNFLDRLILTYSQLLQVGDVLSVVATSTAGNTNCVAALSWKEIR